MKATGVIRRIDDLGRIVIPKEIRKNLRIKNGESLEIFINEDENIILRKYNQIDKLKDLAQELKESIYTITKKDIIITNTQNIIASNKKEYVDKEVSNALIEKIYQRKELNEKNIEIIQGKEENKFITLSPIIANGDLIGSIILLSDEENDSDHQIAKIASNFLARHIEG